MLGVLSNVRDVKSALSAGMLLLLALWLIFGDEVAKVQPGDTAAGRVAILVGYFGPAVTLAAVTFLAYLLGLILPFHFIGLLALNRFNRRSAVREGGRSQEGRLFHFILDRVKQAAEKEALDDLLKHLFRAFPALYEFSFRRPWWIRFAPPRWRSSLEVYRTRKALNYAKKHETVANEKTSPTDWFAVRRAERKTEKQLASLLLQRIYSENALHTVDLGYKDDKAYDRVDKARSESEFRVGLCLPLLILTIVTALQFPSSSFGWTDVVVLGLLWGAVGALGKIWGAGRAVWISWNVLGLLGIFWVAWGAFGIPWGAVGVLGAGCFAALVLAMWATSKAQEAQEEVSRAIILGRIKVPELQVLEEIINTPNRTWSSRIQDAMRPGK